MSDRRLIVASAISGRLLCTFGELHEYCQELLGRPIWTHQFPALFDQFAAKAAEKHPEIAAKTAEIDRLCEAGDVDGAIAEVLKDE